MEIEGNVIVAPEAMGALERGSSELQRVVVSL